jgi:hypothetical protein
MKRVAAKSANCGYSEGTQRVYTVENRPGSQVGDGGTCTECALHGQVDAFRIRLNSRNPPKAVRQERQILAAVYLHLCAQENLPNGTKYQNRF